MEERQCRTGYTRLLRGCLRDAHCGALTVLGASSLLCAWTGDESPWLSSLSGYPRFECLVSGGLWLVLAAVVAWGISMARVLRFLLSASALLLLAISLSDVVAYYSLMIDGELVSQRALPCSLLVLGLTAASLRTPRPVEGHSPRFRPVAVLGLGSGGLLTILFLLLSFGATDYRRSAEVAVVLGAGVWPDGSPSLPLSDRVAEAVRLYDQREVSYLLMTGGVDPVHGASEPETMRRLAVAAGVPAERILLDEEGNNTRASARNTARIMREQSWNRALLVSNGYHLLRSKTAFEREGARVFTVPARESRTLRKGPYFLIRECVAWLYYSLPSAPPSV